MFNYMACIHTPRDSGEYEFYRLIKAKNAKTAWRRFSKIARPAGGNIVAVWKVRSLNIPR